jgi:hypothetical protein
LFCNFLFKSEGIEGALRAAFGGGSNLFGPLVSTEPECNKVAVIATGEEEEQPVLLANYNREWRVQDDKRKFSGLHSLMEAGERLIEDQEIYCEGKRGQRTS